MFIYVPTCIHMSYRQNELFISKKQRKWYMSMVYCWINIEFCVKIGKSSSYMLAPLTLDYSEYDMKKLRVFEWHRWFEKGLRWCGARWQKRWAAKNAKDRCKCGQSMNLGVLRSKIRSETNSTRMLWESVQGKRPKLSPDIRIFHHDNAPAHSA
jgi:hypothetical protein